MLFFGPKNGEHLLEGKTEHQYQPTPGRHRIVTLGDSYTFGDEVSDDETYSQYLERFLPDTEVMNFGLSGYGHDQMLLYLEQEGVKYHPDVVLIGYVWFDIFRNLAEFTSYSKPRFELRGKELRLTNMPVPPPESILDNEIYRLKAIDLGVILSARVRGKLDLNPTPAETITRGILDRPIATVHNANSIPVFVYLPVLNEILNEDAAMTANEQFWFTFCHERKHPCLFLRKSFVDAQRNGETFNTRSHWFVNSHNTAARRIAVYL